MATEATTPSIERHLSLLKERLDMIVHLAFYEGKIQGLAEARQITEGVLHHGKEDENNA